jgi:23S rRNA pseudouridine1911/1915/1917 synthase
MKGNPIPSPSAAMALLPWLHQALGASMPKARVTQLLRMGRVAVNGATVTRHDHPVGPADAIALLPKDAVAAVNIRQGCRVPVVHMDDQIIVVDKPAGLLSVATETNTTDTAFTRLREWLEQNRGGRPFVVHRLDRETSGLLLFARSAEVRDRLQAGWDQTSKIYLALCAGVPNPPEGTIDSYLEEGDDLKVRVRPRGGGGAKRAVSRYRALATRRGSTLMEVALETGRKHQIRVHLASLGCPVAGDRVYGSGEGPRMALHAWKLAFQHPGTGKDMAFEALPPAIFGPIPANRQV